MTTRAAKATAAADEIAAIEDLMADLEKRLTRLSSVTRREVSGASGDVGDFVSEALSRITNRVRETAAEASHSVADEVSRFGTDAFKKLTDEVEQRPLIMLAVAAGIGFLAGLANRR
jgi:ElaB/YqjD/DUF883 family membrane-anchored ribosome-binding protein